MALGSFEKGMSGFFFFSQTVRSRVSASGISL